MSAVSASPRKLEILVDAALLETAAVPYTPHPSRRHADRKADGVSPTAQNRLGNGTSGSSAVSAMAAGLVRTRASTPAAAAPTRVRPAFIPQPIACGGSTSWLVSSGRVLVMMISVSGLGTVST